MRRLAFLVAVLAAATLAPSAVGARPDFSYNILPPGQYGGARTNPNSTDQIPLYDALTPLRGNVTVEDIRRLFKRQDFRPNGETRRVETGRPGLTILRDKFGVPHIYGRTREDVWFGAGYVTAQDRQLLLLLGRRPARAAVADIPGINAFGLVTSGRNYVPSAQAEALVTSQRQKLVEAYGDKGRRILSDLEAYAAGLTAAGTVGQWTANDALAVTAFIGSIFGNGGGREVRNAQFLAKLRSELGARRGSGAFEDFLEADDPEAPTTTDLYFPYGRSSGRPTEGSPVVDPGSVEELDPLQPSPTMSNWLLVHPFRSATGESLFVGGPQLGYYYPEIVLEASLHGPGLLAQGVLVPGGGPYVLIGRTRDYAWSLTSASNDNIDQFLEELCEPDGSAPTRASRHYLHRGRCVAMETFDAGTLDGRPLRFPTTVHGPVQGTATVDGKPYAIARQRSTYGEDALSIAALRDMTLNRGRTVRGFFRSANEFGFTFNWAYANRRHTAFFSSGKLPRRAPGTNKLLPTLGTGEYDWRGFISRRDHPHDVGGPGGLLLNWNNKAAPGWQHGDDTQYGSVHRVEMFDGWPRHPRIQDVVGISNRAATEDLRATEVWPVVSAVLRGGRAPDARTAQAASLVDAWARRGGSRVDRELDGKIDDPGVAVLDAAWERIANAVLTPVLGALVEDLDDLRSPDSPPYRANGSSFGGGWYSYVDKDLRTLLGGRVRGKFNLRYCGEGSLSACRESLWRALEEATDELAAAQGGDPSAWRSDATRERIDFTTGLIPHTMRWTNRPTFQQVVRFSPFPPR